MDVLVTWKDGSQNVVTTTEIETVRKRDKFQVGVKIKMFYDRKWYYGTITAVEAQHDMDIEEYSQCAMVTAEPSQHAMETEEITSDDEPLCKYTSSKGTTNEHHCEYRGGTSSVLTTCFQCSCFLCTYHYETSNSCDQHSANAEETSNEYFNKDVDYSIFHDINYNDLMIPAQTHEHNKLCEFFTCTEEVFSSCHRCSCFLCWDHFVEETTSCEKHFSSVNLHLMPALVSDVNIFPSAIETRSQRCEFKNCTNSVMATCFNCNCLLCGLHFDLFAASCLNHDKPTVNIHTQKFEKIPPEESLTDCEDMETNVLNISGETAVLEANLDNSPSILRNDSCNTSRPLFCELYACINVVDSACSTCNLSLCSPHLRTHNASCTQSLTNGQINHLAPEDYVVEGSPRETEFTKPKKINKFKQAKNLRQLGKEYISPYTKKVVPGRKLGTECNLEYCAKYGNYCYLFTEEERENILLDYYSTGDLSLQREYIVRFVEKKLVARRTTATESRRQFTYCFHLPLKGSKHKVCKKMFLNTLGISEKSVRTSLEKVKDTGVLEKDKRGGRQESYLEEDALKRNVIKSHINRYPRVEAHFCRKNSKKEYLHPDLSLRIMHSMFLAEYEPKVSFTLYRNVFKEMNLSFHRPKKDQCSLCITYREGSLDTKRQLQDKYDQHVSEKDEVRKVKAECKNQASETIRCASFDLQQVIYLPQSNESAVFYKRRLANFNFTIYDLGSRDCVCNLWHEGISKRGASEISSAVFYYLKNYDIQGVKTVYLFCDGCQGQNKNSVMAAMLMYFMFHCESVEEISLRFFCPSHGQSEGDSVHSAVSHAMSKAGNIFVPSQLVPIIRLARAKPYNVKEYNYNDFLNFKNLSLNLKLLLLRKDDQRGEAVKWTDLMEFRVIKSKLGTLFFKTSHLEQEYRSITVKRRNIKYFRGEVEPINKSPMDIKITKDKYKDLLSMCTGETPIIRNQEHMQFYRSLPHE